MAHNSFETKLYPAQNNLRADAACLKWSAQQQFLQTGGDTNSPECRKKEIPTQL